MPVVTQRWSSGGLTKSTQGWRATIVHDVTGATSKDDAIAAVPFQLNAQHPSNPLLRCVDVDCPEFFVGTMATVTETFQQSQGSVQDQGDPLNQKPRILWGEISESVPVDFDIDNNPICNLAGDPFDPAANREYTDWTISYYRYEPFYDFITAMRYKGGINTFEMTIMQNDGQSMTFPAGTIRLLKIIPAEEYALDATAVKIGYHLQMRPFPDFVNESDYAYKNSPYHIWRKNTGFNGWFHDTVAGKIRKGKIFSATTNDEISVVTSLDENGNPTDTDSFYVGRKGANMVENPIPVRWPELFTSPDGKTRLLVFKNYPGRDLRELNM